jgi:hypothetical protein
MLYPNRLCLFFNKNWFLLAYINLNPVVLEAVIEINGVVYIYNYFLYVTNLMISLLYSTLQLLLVSTHSAICRVTWTNRGSLGSDHRLIQ